MPRRNQFFPKKSRPMAVAALAAVILLAVQPPRLGTAAEAKDPAAQQRIAESEAMKKADRAAAERQAKAGATKDRPANAENPETCDKGAASLEAKDYGQAVVFYTRCLEEGNPTPGLRAATLNDRGLAYNKKGQPDKAIKDLNEAIRLKPDFTVAFIARGVAYYKKGQYDQAIKDLNEAIRLKPDFAVAFIARGLAYDQKGQYDRAIKDYDEAIRLDPKNAAAFTNRGSAYDEKGQPDQAIKDLDEAIRLKPDYAAAFNNRGLAYAKMGQYDRTIKDYDEAIRLNPKYAAAFHNRGVAYYHKNRFERALEDFNEAIRLKPDFAWAYLSRGATYKVLSRTDKSLSDFARASELGSGSGGAGKAGTPAAAQPVMGDTDQAKVYSIAGDSKALIEMRTMLTKDEDAETATRELKKSARAGNVAAQVLLGDLHMNGEGVPHNYSMAVSWYRLAADAGNAEGQYKLALMYQNRLGLPLDHKQAREWLMKAAALGHWKARENLKQKGIEPPPGVRPKEPEKKPEKTADEAMAEKALEKAAEKLKLGEMMDKSMAFYQKADIVLAKLRAEAAKGAVADAMAVTITGNQPPPETVAPVAAIRDLVSRYAAAVNAKDLAQLKELMKPEYAACVNEENKAAYDDYLADGLGFNVAPGYTFVFGKLNPAAALPFLDLVTYPVRPGHYVRIDLNEPPTRADDGAVELGTSVIQYIAGREGDWSLVFGCPTPGGLEIMRQASGAAEKG